MRAPDFSVDFRGEAHYTSARARSKLSKETEGEVAQSVERETENLCVGGSIPSLATPLIPPENT